MAEIRTIMLDLETFSSVDLLKCGVYRYASSPDFDILLFGFSVDGGEVQVFDLACGEEIPADIVEALSDDSIIKWSYNNNFERVCQIISAHGSSRGAGAARWCGRLTLDSRGHWRM